MSLFEVCGSHAEQRGRTTVSAVFQQSLELGDVVLYRTSRGHVAPARLVEVAGGGCWLARDARPTRELLYLDLESIVACLPRPDLLDEAA